MTRSLAITETKQTCEGESARGNISPSLPVAEDYSRNTAGSRRGSHSRKRGQGGRETCAGTHRLEVKRTIFEAPIREDPDA